MNTSESTIQAEIRCELSKHGIQTFRMQSGTFLSMDGKRVIHCGVTGMSDLLLVFPNGLCGWIETKRASGGRKLQEQKDFIDAMQQQGCKAGFAKSVQEALEVCRL